jgi:hypothetical protein
MMRHSQRLLCTTLALAACGCDAESECGARASTYTPSYTEQTGDCGAYTGHSWFFSETLAARIVQLGDGTTVASEVRNEDGCTVDLTQSAERNGNVVERIDGAGLRLDENGAIHGEVMLLRFDAEGEVTCSGEYAVRLTKPESPPSGSGSEGGGAY